MSAMSAPETVVGRLSFAARRLDATLARCNALAAYADDETFEASYDDFTRSLKLFGDALRDATGMSSRELARHLVP